MVEQRFAAAAAVTCPYNELVLGRQDTCFGTNDADRISGSPQDDLIYAYSGNDTIYGNAGDDVFYDHDGDDNIIGGDGNDTLYGGVGNDTSSGGPGTDKLIGGEGNDKYDGGSHTDQLVDVSKYSSDTYFGLRAVALGSGNDVMRDSGSAGSFYSTGSDILDLSTLEMSQVSISWVDTSADADTNRDSLRVQQKSTTNTMLVDKYFDNAGGTGRRVGAIEKIRFKGFLEYASFPISQG